MSVTVTSFVSVLEDAGVQIKSSGENIILTGKTSALPPETIQWLKEHKPAVLAMLRIRQNPVRRWISLDGEAEAFSSHALDPAYWRLADQDGES